MAIGAGWANGAWVDAGWVVAAGETLGAWNASTATLFIGNFTEGEWRRRRNILTSNHKRNKTPSKPFYPADPNRWK